MVRRCARDQLVPLVGGARQEDDAQHDRRRPPPEEARLRSRAAATSPPGGSCALLDSRQTVVHDHQRQRQRLGRRRADRVLAQEDEVGHDQRAEERDLRDAGRLSMPHWPGLRRMLRSDRADGDCRGGAGHDGGDASRFAHVEWPRPSLVLPVRIVRVLQVPQRPAAVDGRDRLEVVRRAAARSSSTPASRRPRGRRPPAGRSTATRTGCTRRWRSSAPG